MQRKRLIVKMRVYRGAFAGDGSLVAIYGLPKTRQVYEKDRGKSAGFAAQFKLSMNWVPQTANAPVYRGAFAGGGSLVVIYGLPKIRQVYEKDRGKSASFATQVRLSMNWVPQTTNAPVCRPLDCLPKRWYNHHHCCK